MSGRRRGVRSRPPSAPRAQGREGQRDGAVSPGVPRYLRGTGSASDALVIQRQEEAPAALPPTPSFQLTPPSLLQPRDPYARYMPDFGFRLRMDPELRMQMMARARLMLAPDSVLAGVASVAPVVAAQPASPTGSSSRAGPASSTTAGPAGTPTVPAVPTTPPGPTAPTPQPLPTPPGTAPPTAPGSGSTEGVPSPEVEIPRRGGGGDVLGAVLATPQVSGLLQDVQNRFTSGFSTYWDAASTGERTLFVGSSVVVGGGILAPMLGFEEPRNFVLPLLNNVVLPVPGLSGYGLEFRFGERDVMVGAHLDVGALLPSVWGFGPASFGAIGGPPGSDPNALPPPIYPKEGEGGAKAPAADVPVRIRQARGGGRPLPEAERHRFGEGAEGDLDEVRVHDGPDADRLARDLGAVAFVSGSDVFFRSGAWGPASSDGARLLAHELAHVRQQARGELPPPLTGTEVRMGRPGDTLEREADRVADALTERDPGATSAGVPEGEVEVEEGTPRPEGG